MFKFIKPWFKVCVRVSMGSCGRVLMGLCGRRGVVICHILKEHTTKDVIPGMARAEIGDLTNEFESGENS